MVYSLRQLMHYLHDERGAGVHPEFPSSKLNTVYISPEKQDGLLASLVLAGQEPLAQKITALAQELEGNTVYELFNKAGKEEDKLALETKGLSQQLQQLGTMPLYLEFIPAKAKKLAQLIKEIPPELRPADRFPELDSILSWLEN